jgi:hypothetical protein
MTQRFVVRHWKGQDAVERVVAEQRIEADHGLDALLRCVPLEATYGWHLAFPVWEYAALTNPDMPREDAEYWEAEVSFDPTPIEPAPLYLV